MVSSTEFLKSLNSSKSVLISEITHLLLDFFKTNLYLVLLADSILSLECLY